MVAAVVLSLVLSLVFVVVVPDVAVLGAYHPSAVDQHPAAVVVSIGL